MPTWFLISFLLLLGACQDEVVGQIRQLNTNSNLRLPADTYDVWVSEESYSDTVIDDTTIVTDTIPVDTAPDTIEDTTVPEADAPDTSVPDTTTVVETIEDTTLPDTAPEIIDTTTEVDTTPPECEDDLDCEDSDDCTLDYCENSLCVHEENIACTEDSDNDGILDFEDLCPLHPEFYDLYDDHDGCPEEDQDHDGWTFADGDCEDNPSSGDDPASFCWNEVDGFHLMIHFGVGADQRPTCDYYDEDGELIEGLILFETNGVFLIGPQVEDTPDDDVDQDCDGETDEAGEYGLTPPDCYWGSFDDGSEVVWCWWMDDLYEL